MKAVLVLDEMPKNCFSCPLHNWDKNGLGIIMCSIKTEETNCEQRPIWCPLKELKETMVKTIKCKECKYWRKNEYMVNLDTGEYCGTCGVFWEKTCYYKENDYCSLADRKEE